MIPVAFFKGTDKAIPTHLPRVPAVGEYVEIFIGNRVAMEGTVVTVKNLINATNIEHPFHRVEVFLQ
jgi:hypothetical protein